MQTGTVPATMADAAPAEPTRGTAAILAEIAAGVASGGDLGALLQRFLEPIVQLAGAQAGAVRVLSDDGEQLQLVSAIGLPSTLCNQELAVDRHCGHCGDAADGRPLVWASDLRVCAARSGDWFGESGRRLLAVPLRHRGRVLGVYNLFFSGTDEPSVEVQAILKSIGELLGLALNNSRLEAEHLRSTLARERHAMAAEVHDSLAQSLAFVKMRLPLLEDALRSHDEARALHYCGELRDTVRQAHAALRGIVTDLRAPMDPHGLDHALRDSVELFRRSSGVELNFSNELPALRLGHDQESQIFHVVQEALANIARHASAHQAWLHIASDTAGGVQIVVDDDGIGFAGPAGNSHYGLEIMRERARRIGGQLDVGPRAGGGTRVRLTLGPVAASQGRS